MRSYFCKWYRSQVVRPRSAKPLFASSNLAGTSKKRQNPFGFCLFLSFRLRFKNKLQHPGGVLLAGQGPGDTINFFRLSERKCKQIWPVPALAKHEII